MTRQSELPTTPNVALCSVAEEFVENYREIRESRKNWLLFVGPPGTGKTTQAALTARRLIEQKLTPTRFYNAFDLTRRLVALRTRQAEFEKIFEEFAEVPVVVLDDFLKVVPSPNSFDYENIREATTRAIWARYDARRPTIITTQRSLNDVWRFDEALAGRVFEMCGGRVVEFGGNSKNWRLGK